MGNMSYSDNTVAADVVDILAARLPPGWQAAVSARERGGGTTPPACVDMVLKIRGPGAPAGLVLVGAKTRLEPKDVDYLAVTLRPTPKQPVLVAAPFISTRTQERLEAQGFGYADLTGNVRLSLSQPGLFVETTGASENPEPSLRDRKSLKGAKAGRLVRALCDFRTPMGLREAAKRAGVDAGYASRVVGLLNREALITRSGRTPITSVDWQGLLRRWSQEYSPFRRGGATMYLAPRGVPAVVDKLKSVRTRFAVTGSWVAAQVAPVAPPRLLLVYVDERAVVDKQLDLRPTDTGANVALLTPFDGVVYERASKKNGIACTALSQVVADLLTSPGRGPKEAEALMEWMRDNEGTWRV